MADCTQTALSLAARHPQALLPCPVCAVSVRAANLERHMGKSHPGAADLSSEWSDVRGVSMARLSIDADALALRTRSGLRTRREPLTDGVVLGAVVKSGTSSLMSSYADDYPTLAETTSKRAGVYLG